MSILFAENFGSYAIPTTPTGFYRVADDLSVKLESYVNANNNQVQLYRTASPFSGDSRPWLNMINGGDQSLDGYAFFKFPFTMPSSNKIYFSWRVAIPEVGTNTSRMKLPFILAVSNSHTTYGPATIKVGINDLGTITTDLVLSGNVYAETVPTRYYDITTPTLLEIEYDQVAKTYSLWVNENLFTTKSMALPNVGYNYFKLGCFFQSGVHNPVARALISDVIMIEDDGVSPSYRLGRSGRVQLLTPATDVTTEWTPSEGYVGTHAALMAAKYSNAAGAYAQGLTSALADQKEIYQMSALDSSLGDKVYGLMPEGYMSNTSASVRTLAFTAQSGATPLDMGQRQISAGGDLQLLRPWVDLNPATGLPWTVSEVNAAQFGFRSVS